MSAKKKYAKRRGQHTGNHDTTAPHTAISTVPISKPSFTLTHVRALWRKHPIQPNALIRWSAAVALISFLAAVAAIKGMLSRFLLDLAGDNLGPRTAILAGAFALCMASGIIALRGPFQSRSGWLYHTLCVALSRFALGTWGTLCGISLGVFTAALLLGFPASPYFWELCQRLFPFLSGIFVFTTISVVPNDAPGYASRRFRGISRLLAAILFLLMLGWFITGSLYVDGMR